MTELLGGACLVAVGAEAADVAVIVAATLGERNDMVRYCGFPDDPLGDTVPAQRFGL